MGLGLVRVLIRKMKLLVKVQVRRRRIKVWRMEKENWMSMRLKKK